MDFKWSTPFIVSLRVFSWQGSEASEWPFMMHLLAFGTKDPSFSDVERGRKTDNCLSWPWPDTEWRVWIILHNPLTSSFLFLMQFHPGAHISLGSLDLRRHPVLWISSRRKWPGPCLGTGISWIGQCPDNCLVCTHQHRLTGLLSPQHSMIFLVWCYGNECRMAEAREQAKETALILVYWQYTILCCYSLS